MRISTDREDAGFDLLRQHNGSARVWMEDVEMRNVITADDAEGLVVVAKTDAQGRFCADRERGEFVRETLHGHVAIQLSPGR